MFKRRRPTYVLAYDADPCLGDGDAVRSYQSIKPFYEEGDYSACQRLLILEELESGLGEWEYGAEIYFV